MKRMLAIIMALCMILCAGCGSETAGTTQPAETTTPVESAPAAVNEGQLQTGVYGGSATYAEGEFSMTWTFTISFNEDSTFVLVNDSGEEKGAGTWALTGDSYTMTYSDERTCNFVILADGTMQVVNDLPYGQNGISPDMVGGIVLSYMGEGSTMGGEGSVDATTGATTAAGDFTLSAGTYTASYTKESAMAGTVVYVYTAQVGEDGSFSYAVTFQMGEDTYDGSAASGTYTLENDVFTFTDSEGNVTEGALTANDTLVISLMASAMAKEPYEVTFTNGPLADTNAALAAGAYTGSYTKESPMAGTVVYVYTAQVGEDGSFSYAVTFQMGEDTYDGSAASGTYTLENGVFTFTDSEGNVTEGAVTAENELTIALMASSMAKEPYEVTFTAAE